MAIEIKMPALSPTMTTGSLGKWFVNEGDVVSSGDIIAEIETDKATMEIEAGYDGVLAKIYISSGSKDVGVGETIAVIAEEGEEIEIGSLPSPSIETKEFKKIARAPRLSNETEETGSDVDKRIFVSPLARRIAGEHGINLIGLEGSGPRGRVIRRDIEKIIESKRINLLESEQKQSSNQVVNSNHGVSELLPNSQMRKVIAGRLQESKQQAPHFYLTMDCMIDELLDARAALNLKVPDGVKISVNDMIIKAAAMALIEVPDANVSWEGAKTRRYRHADIAIAVAIDGGLVTPIIWAAEQKGMVELAQISQDLATRARNGSLKPEEYSGGSFTISNLGMFGVREFSAVINPPHGGILAVGAGEPRPIVIEKKLGVGTVMTVTLSADHRVIDGAVGARWLKAFKGFVESPVTMML